VDIAAELTLLLGLPVSNLTDLHSDYTYKVKIILKSILLIWKS